MELSPQKTQQEMIEEAVLGEAVLYLKYNFSDNKLDAQKAWQGYTEQFVADASVKEIECFLEVLTKGVLLSELPRSGNVEGAYLKTIALGNIAVRLQDQENPQLQQYTLKEIRKNVGFLQMQREFIGKDATSYFKRRFLADSLIDVYSQIGQADNARKILDSSKRDSYDPESAYCNCLLHYARKLAEDNSEASYEYSADILADAENELEMLQKIEKRPTSDSSALSKAIRLLIEKLYQKYPNEVTDYCYNFDPPLEKGMSYLLIEAMLQCGENPPDEYFQRAMEEVKTLGRPAYLRLINPFVKAGRLRELGQLFPRERSDEEQLEFAVCVEEERINNVIAKKDFTTAVERIRAITGKRVSTADVLARILGPFMDEEELAPKIEKMEQDTMVFSRIGTLKTRSKEELLRKFLVQDDADTFKKLHSFILWDSLASNEHLAELHVRREEFIDAEQLAVEGFVRFVDIAKSVVEVTVRDRSKDIDYKRVVQYICRDFKERPAEEYQHIVDTCAYSVFGRLAQFERFEELEKLLQHFEANISDEILEIFSSNSQYRVCQSKLYQQNALKKGAWLEAMHGWEKVVLDPKTLLLVAAGINRARLRRNNEIK